MSSIRHCGNTSEQACVQRRAQTLDKSDNKLYKLTKNIQWPKTKLRIERGEMPETLLEIMQKEQCDLLVCGHHHSFINRLMPAYRGMINKMSADLLIVPFIDK